MVRAVHLALEDGKERLGRVDVALAVLTDVLAGRTSSI